MNEFNYTYVKQKNDRSNFAQFQWWQRTFIWLNAHCAPDYKLLTLKYFG